MLRVIVWVCIDFTCGNEDERRVDVDWEFDVSIFVSVYLEFCFLFSGLVEGFVFLLFVLDFFFNGFIYFTKPLCTGKNFSLCELEPSHIGDSYFVYLSE